MSDRYLDSLGKHPTLFTAWNEGIVFAPGDTVRLGGVEMVFGEYKALHLD